MATETIVLIPQGTHSGFVPFGPVALPSALALTYRLESDSFTDPAVAIAFRCEHSLDGEEWRPLYGFTAVGGYERNGDPRQVCIVDRCAEPTDLGTIRGDIEVQGEIVGGLLLIVET